MTEGRELLAVLVALEPLDDPSGTRAKWTSATSPAAWAVGTTEPGRLTAWDSSHSRLPERPASERRRGREL